MLKEKVRNSAFELLRIVAMFMVLSLHANFLAIGAPTTAEFHVDAPNALARGVLEVVCIGAVDLFVLISGWYGIRPTRRGLLKFLFQSFFIITLVSVVGLVSGQLAFNKEVARESLLFTHAWFVVAYVGLYVLSPVLNIFIQRASRKEYAAILAAFFFFQTLYGCFSDTGGYNYGYSVISFIGLYLLARFANLYLKGYARWGKAVAVCSLFACILIYSTCLYVREDMVVNDLALKYTSPLVIVAMLGVVMWVDTIKPFQNRIINWIAASCFTVYLLHVCNEWSTTLYTDAARYIYANWSGIAYFALIVLFMAGVFVLAVAVDQLRKLAWVLIQKIKK